MMWYICLLQLGWHAVAVVQYTFTHKQYTEQNNETEHTEYYIHNNNIHKHNNKNRHNNMLHLFIILILTGYRRILPSGMRYPLICNFMYILENSLLPLTVELESIINRAASEYFATVNTEQLSAAAPSVVARRTRLPLAEQQSCFLEGGDSRFFRSVSTLIPDYTALLHRDGMFFVVVSTRTLYLVRWNLFTQMFIGWGADVRVLINL
jgi:hypothetical protein